MCFVHEEELVSLNFNKKDTLKVTFENISNRDGDGT